MSSLSESEAVLLGRIKEEFRARRTFEHHMSVTDADGIKKLRSLGRRAGRELGWKVRTFVIDPAEGSSSAMVVLVVTESNPLHEELMTMRADKALRKAFKSWDLGGSDG
jgi:hypothetical protein